MAFILLLDLNVHKFDIGENFLKEKFQTPVSYEIMKYFLQNPDAADTLEGIASWWLVGQKIDYEIDKVSESINELIHKGYIIPTVRAKTNYYRLNMEKRTEIEEIVDIYLSKPQKHE